MCGRCAAEKQRLTSNSQLFFKLLLLKMCNVYILLIKQRVTSGGRILNIFFFLIKVSNLIFLKFEPKKNTFLDFFFNIQLHFRDLNTFTAGDTFYNLHRCCLMCLTFKLAAKVIL